MKLKLAGLVLMAGSALFGQGPRDFNPGQRPGPGSAAQFNYRPELRKFYDRADRLRGEISQDRFGMMQARNRGDWRAETRFRNELAKDQRNLDNLMRDIRQREAQLFQRDHRYYNSYR